MHKVLVFDLDGTLAPISKGITSKDIEKLKRLEKEGYKIGICSGKPTYYLCGFMRQVGLDNPILIGENGGVFQFGVELPPKRFNIYPYSSVAKEQIREIKWLIDSKCEERIWYQPNEIGLTPFPQDEKTVEDIQEILNSQEEKISELLVYRHVDSFDLTPKNINKFNGLEFLAKMEGLVKEDFVAIGDGVNDIPMFQFADISIGIGNKLNYSTDYSFADISDALEFILRERI